MTILAWQRAGEPDDSPVVLVHAWAADGSRDWEATGWVRRLTDAGFAVLVPDLPGHGESADVLLPPDAEPAAWTASALAADLGTLGVGRVQAAGYAEGCLVAGHLASLAADGDPGPAGVRPGQVGSLVLIAADDHEGVPFGEEIAGALRDQTSRLWHPEAAEAVAAARSDPRHHLPTLALWAGRAAWPAAPRLGSLHIPVLLGVAAEDERRSRAPRLAQLFHDARLVTVPGDPHAILTRPELQATVTRFLTDHAEGG
ncbi:MAG TPA: alpha/beta fold hydrolase [Egibacteraceae bacterium]|nr:alpha/beta fold hydrolase [Egibacteraceae bacterium]